MGFFLKYTIDSKRWTCIQILKYVTKVDSNLGGFHSHRGTPIAAWFMMEKSHLEMDDDWG